MATPAAAQHAEQQQQDPQQQQQRAAAQVRSNGTGSSTAAVAGGADASMLAPGGSIELRNVYFEAVPLNLVSALVTDKGLMNQVQVAALMQSRGRGYEHAFGLSLPQDMVAA
jgi:translation initiation factor 2B subunit (eIF-2B alpha/beta/delta family)